MAKTIKAPRGWDESQDNGARLATNGIATVRIEPWRDLQGQSLLSWLESLEEQPPAGAQFVSSAGVKPETVPGAYSVIRKIAFGQSQGHSVLYACPGTEGYGRLMTLDVTDANFKDTLVGAMFGERVCKNERRTEQTTAAIETHEQAPAEPPVTPEPMPERHDVATPGAPVGLVELRGVIVMGIQPGGMFGFTDDFIALFDDGTYTSDLINTFGRSVAVSKKKEPRDWGEWRERNDELELRDSKQDAFEETRGNWVIEASPTGHKLSGCYGRLNTSSGGDYSSGTTVGLASTWCFWPDGRFTNSRTAFGSSSNVTMRRSNPKAHGRYHINGYVAQFVYDDGHKVTSAFGYASAKGNHLLLNGKRFMGSKP